MIGKGIVNLMRLEQRLGRGRCCRESGSGCDACSAPAVDPQPQGATAEVVHQQHVQPTVLSSDHGDSLSHEPVGEWAPVLYQT